MFQIGHFVAADQCNHARPKPTRSIQRFRSITLQLLGPAFSRGFIHLSRVGVCTENLIHVDEVTESPKLVEMIGLLRFGLAILISLFRSKSRLEAENAVVCTENPIRIDDVTESPKLAE
jgi:hypothetical protein